MKQNIKGGINLKKLGKINVSIVFGILIAMNFVAAMPAGDSGDEIKNALPNDPEEPLIPNELNIQDEPPTLDENQKPEDRLILDDPLTSDEPDIPDDTILMGSPPPPPDPTGFDTPVTPVSGVRPLLTVLLEYTDLPSNVSASYIEDQVFGPRPSMNDYFIETSYGSFQFSNAGHFTWITAWDDPLTPEDESTWAYWESAPDPTYRSGMARAHALTSLDKAGFDFAPLDTNMDGTIELGKELACQVAFSRPEGSRGAANRGIPPLNLDGKDFTGSITGVSEESPWITLFAHELGHETLGLPDYYGIKPRNIGQFSLMGYSGTSGWAGPYGPQHLDPYSKLKKGWLTPTVVTSDGFYDIPDAETNPVSFILHDPAHGTDEYFMVENRWKGTSYDDSSSLIPAMTPPLPPAHVAYGIPDQGVLIWHVDETRAWNGSSTGGYPKVNLTRRGGSDSTACFDGNEVTNYDFYDGSSLENAHWNGGITSKVGVWAVSGAGPTMRAWLDVPGPGILEVLLTDSVSAIPGSAGTLSVRAVNTGDLSDTFSFSVVGLPGDLTEVSPGPVTLGPKAETNVDFEITPIRHWSTAPGIRTFKLRAESTTDPSIWIEIDASLEVLPFGEPHLSIPVNFAEIDPGMTASYTVEIVNGGNVEDTFALSIDSIDFVSLYNAFPTAIDGSWVSFSPADPTAVAGGSTTTSLRISVPWDWAAMEDATYEFNVTATSSITPDNDSATGQLLVHATPLSMMFYVKVELMNLISDIEALTPSDVRDGLHDKATSALHKINQSIDRYLLGDDPPASNLFRTTQNKLKAFLHLLDAQRGKTLTVAQTDDLYAKAQKIRDDIDAILLVI
jgi:M6 family metalloprotease-like protein